jgi:hypothetical protein
MKIEARFGGGELFFPGMVSEVNEDGTLFIAYDDGDEELSVPVELVRPGFDAVDEDEFEDNDNMVADEPEVFLDMLHFVVRCWFLFLKANNNLKNRCVKTFELTPVLPPSAFACVESQSPSTQKQL